MSDETTAVPLVARFPALRRLAKVGARKVPYIAQHSDVECGVACMAMVLAYHGKQVPREELRAALGPTRDGVRAAHLLRTGRHFGLRARGFKGEVDALAHVPRGSVLHWDFNHYVVLQGVGKRHIDIVDPGRGPRRVAMAEVDRCFTGVVLVFEPGSDFETGDTRPKRVGLLDTLRGAGDWGRVFSISFAAQLVTLALPMLVALIVDRVLPRKDVQLLHVVSFGLALIVLFYWLTQMVRGHLLLHVRTVMDAKMSMELVDRLLALPYSYFQQRSVGDLVMRLESSKVVREILTSGALTAVLDGTMMFLYLALLLAMSPLLGLVVLAFGSLNVLALLLMRGKRRAFHAELIDRQAASESYQFEMLNAIETIKGMGCEHHAVERWCNLFVDLLNNQLRYGRLEILFSSFTTVLRMGAPLVIFAIGAMEVLSGKMSIGAMLAVNTFAVGIFDPLSRLVEKLEDFERLKIYLDRMLDIHESPREQPLGRTPLHEPLSGAIELQGVSFRHGPLERDVVKDVSLSIRPGEFVGVVGPSGAGKSSLASLVLGLYAPSEGRILYDGRSLEEVDLTSLRAQMGVVTQDTHLFAGTIRHNIAMSDPDMPQAEVERAARMAQIHDDIMAMPAGYNTVLAGGGSSISGGQRQRIALARALARRPAILVLDEATSALDIASEAGIQAALEDVPCTRIVIAHRLSTVARADRIVVMQDGEVIEQGPPQQLLQQGAAYAQLVGYRALATPAGGMAAPRAAHQLPSDTVERESERAASQVGAAAAVDRARHRSQPEPARPALREPVSPGPVRPAMPEPEQAAAREPARPIPPAPSTLHDRGAMVQATVVSATDVTASESGEQPAHPGVQQTGFDPVALQALAATRQGYPNAPTHAPMSFRVQAAPMEVIGTRPEAARKQHPVITSAPVVAVGGVRVVR